MGEPAKQRLLQQFAALDPVALLEAIRDTQQELAAIGDGNALPAPPTDIAALLDSLASAWRNEHPPRRQRRRNAACKHWWRTRADPFADSWPLVENWLGAEPNLAAAELLVRLREQHPDLYPTGAQLRTLQRRVKSWRAEWAPPRIRNDRRPRNVGSCQSRMTLLSLSCLSVCRSRRTSKNAACLSSAAPASKRLSTNFGYTRVSTVQIRSLAAGGRSPWRTRLRREGDGGLCHAVVYRREFRRTAVYTELRQFMVADPIPPSAMVDTVRGMIGGASSSEDAVVAGSVKAIICGPRPRSVR